VARPPDAFALDDPWRAELSSRVRRRLFLESLLVVASDSEAVAVASASFPRLAGAVVAVGAGSGGQVSSGMGRSSGCRLTWVRQRRRRLPGMFSVGSAGLLGYFGLLVHAACKFCAWLLTVRPGHDGVLVEIRGAQGRELVGRVRRARAWRRGPRLATHRVGLGRIRLSLLP
jgi:hypothetical protein